MSIQIQRNVLNKQGEPELVVFVFEEPGITPGIATTLANMQKWDIEVRRGLHVIPKQPKPREYDASDYKRIYDLFEIRMPSICHPNKKCDCVFTERVRMAA